MLLQCLQLTGKLVSEPVKEIRLKEITVAVIPAIFLAANSSAALAVTPATVTVVTFIALQLSGVAPLRMLSAGQ